MYVYSTLLIVALPVRSFSLNWISGKTMLSAIWVASSECSEFSWTTNTNTNKSRMKYVPLKSILRISIISGGTVTFAASYSCRQTMSPQEEKKKGNNVQGCILMRIIEPAACCDSENGAMSCTNTQILL